MNKSMRALGAMVALVCAVGCGPEEEKLRPNGVFLTLDSSSVSADSGAVSARALVSDLGRPIAGVEVTFTLTDSASGTLTQTATGAENGYASVTFSDVRVAGAGTVTATVATDITDSRSFTITPGAATTVSLTIVDPPDDPPVVTAGTDLTFSVAAMDAHSNLTGEAIQVATDAPGSIAIGDRVTGLTKAGTYDVTAALSSDLSISESVSFDIAPAAPFRTLTSTASLEGEAGLAYTFECFVLDAFDNLRADTFLVADVSTTAPTFAGGTATVTKSGDITGGGSSFAVGADGSMNVLGLYDNSCLGAGFGGTVQDSSAPVVVEDTTPPANAVVTLTSPTIPVRPDRAMAPGEAGILDVSADDLVGISSIELFVVNGPGSPAAQTVPFDAPAPGAANNPFNFDVAGATFDAVELRARITDTSGNQTVTQVTRVPVDDRADDPVAATFTVRTWALNSDLANAQALTSDQANSLLYYVRDSAATGGIDADGSDLIEIGAGATAPGDLIVHHTNMGGVDTGSRATGGLYHMPDFGNGADDVFFSRMDDILLDADRFVHGVDVASSEATFSADPSGNTDFIPLDLTIGDVGAGNQILYVRDENGDEAIRRINANGTSDAEYFRDSLRVGGATVEAAGGLTVTSNGNVYLADTADGEILEIIDDLGNAAIIHTYPGALEMCTVANGAMMDQLLISNSGGDLRLLDPADAGNPIDLASFGLPADMSYQSAFDVDLDGDGVAENNVPTLLLLDTANSAIYRVTGF